MVPAAPTRFSTMKFCLKALCRRSAVSRATTSVIPPAENGTIKATGRSGQAAWAGDETTIADAIRQCLSAFMDHLPVVPPLCRQVVLRHNSPHDDHDGHGPGPRSVRRDCAARHDCAHSREDELVEGRGLHAVQHRRGPARHANGGRCERYPHHAREVAAALTITSAAQKGDAMTDIAFAPARRLAAMIRKRKIGCLELLDHYLDRVRRYNPALNAIVVTDVPAARKRARAADRALARGEPWGPFHGVPMTIKEAIDVAG